MTTGLVIGLTIYAWKTKTDFTVYGGILWTLGIALFMFMMFSFLFRTHFTSILYSSIIVVIFGIYLVFDT